MVTRRLCNCALHPACSSHAETELLPLQAANCEHAFAGVLRSIAQAGGAALWANSAKGYEDALQLCLAHLEDASRATGDAFAGALGDLVAASKSPAALQGVRTMHLTKLCIFAQLCCIQWKSGLSLTHAVGEVARHPLLSMACIRDRPVSLSATP